MNRIQRYLDRQAERLIFGDTKTSSASVGPSSDTLTIEKLLECMERFKKPVLSKIKGNGSTLAWLQRYLPEKKPNPVDMQWPYFYSNVGGVPIYEDEEMYDGFLEFCDQYDNVMHRYVIYAGELYEINLDVINPRRPKEETK